MRILTMIVYSLMPVEGIHMSLIQKTDMHNPINVSVSSYMGLVGSTHWGFPSV